MGADPDLFVDLSRLGCDDQQRILLIPLIQHLDHLGAAELENNRIQRCIKTEKNACQRENAHVAEENVVPCVDSLLLRKVDGNEIRSAAAGPGQQADADGHPVEDSAENADQQGVVCNGDIRQQIRQEAGQKHHIKRKDGEPLSDKPEPDIGRHDIQRQIDQRVRNRHMEKLASDPLN